MEHPAFAWTSLWNGVWSAGLSISLLQQNNDYVHMVDEVSYPFSAESASSHWSFSLKTKKKILQKISEKQGEIWVENAIWFALLAEEEKEKNFFPQPNLEKHCWKAVISDGKITSADEPEGEKRCGRSAKTACGDWGYLPRNRKWKREK